MKRDFDYEVMKKADEQLKKREKELIRKYKGMYEREKEILEKNLKKEFEMRIKEVKQQLDSEKAEVARLKSLE